MVNMVHYNIISQHLDPIIRCNTIALHEIYIIVLSFNNCPYQFYRLKTENNIELMALFEIIVSG